MEFDKSKVYTAVNADELEIGSKVFVAKNLHALHDQFCENNICTLVEVKSEDYQDRFVATFDHDTLTLTTTLAYLVSEPEEKKLKWTDLKIGDVIRTKDNKEIRMVTGIDNREEEDGLHILAVYWLSDKELENWEKVEE